ncbi:MAG: spore germination protein, partial [Firmicutes bacterium]|nr:spore germination protein [Bacillota bacterium]
EALIMEVTFEAIREAGVRMPKALGSAISIVGALVVGQAAVQAGLVSAPMVIIVSVTGIASFTIPRFNFAIAIRMLRFPVIILAGLFGIFGIVFSVICIMLHVCSLRSFGVPYMSPMAPLNVEGLKNEAVRRPWWGMRKRPRQENKGNQTRQSDATTPANRIPGLKKRQGGTT